MSFIALLDANVLWPAALRCTLVRAAVKELYRPVWTERILDEMASTLEREGRVQSERIRRTVELMKSALPHALVEGYEELIFAMRNDPGDRHVLAAAVCAGAGTIVTSNVQHFPEGARAAYAIDVHTPDEFLLDLWDLDAPAMAEVITEQAAALSRPPCTVQDVLNGMRPLVPQFVELALGSDLLGHRGSSGSQHLLHETRPAYSTRT